MSPVPPDEFILRRIHQNHCDRALPVPILLAGFRPSKADTAGLSVYRVKDISPAQVAASGDTPGRMRRRGARSLYAVEGKLAP